jgi:hypothetical protein
MVTLQALILLYLGDNTFSHFYTLIDKTYQGHTEDDGDDVITYIILSF